MGPKPNLTCRQERDPPFRPGSVPAARLGAGLRLAAGEHIGRAAGGLGGDLPQLIQN